MQDEGEHQAREDGSQQAAYHARPQTGQGGAYLYDFASGHWWYTSPTYAFPNMVDFDRSGHKPAGARFITFPIPRTEVTTQPIRDISITTRRKASSPCSEGIRAGVARGTVCLPAHRPADAQSLVSFSPVPNWTAEPRPNGRGWERGGIQPSPESAPPFCGMRNLERQPALVAQVP
jgi:hypothetical protein